MYKRQESGFKSLEDNGLNIFHFPMIRTKPISNITKIDLDQIDCIIFVSKNGVKYFFEDSNSKKFNLSEKFFICIGEKTSSVLNELKWKKIFLFNPGEEEFLLYKI